MTPQMIDSLKNGIFETLYMVVMSTAFAYIIGIPLGVALYITDKNGICKNKVVNFILGLITNLIRSIPFLILVVAIIPFTRAVVGTSIGPGATIVPLVISAAPFVARMVESSLNEVNQGVIEAALAMGSSKIQIIFKVLLPEAKPSLLLGGTITLATVLGYSAMAGTIGGGGLGMIAITYGYQRFNNDIIWICVLLTVIIVQLIQEIGMLIAKKTDKRINK